MARNEYKAVFALLGLVAILTAIDVSADLYLGSTLRHILIEVAAIAVALGGMGYIWRRILSGYRSRLLVSEERGERLREDAERWRHEAAQYVHGLSQAIDRQFSQWELTASEKEVALLLLKGLSLKEIATVREVREKTIRQQCQAVYRKGGLAGRAELSAYFLEDLLAPLPEMDAGAGLPQPEPQ